MAESKKEMKEKEEIIEEVVEESKEEAEEEIEEDSGKLPFPRSVVVRQIRANIDKGKQIKGQVKDEMNIWLGKTIAHISKKMNAHPYSYVDYSMFKEAIETYEKLEEIELEKERLIKYMEKMKADIEMLEREIDKKFTLK